MNDDGVLLAAACRAVPGLPVPELAERRPVPTGSATRWWSAGELADLARVRPLLDPSTVAGSRADRLTTVVAYAQGLAYATAGPSVAGSVTAGLVLDIAPEGVWFGLGAGGFCHRLAVRHGHVRPATSGFETRVADQVASVLWPAFETAHRLTRVGRRVLWSVLSDSIHLVALHAVLATPRRVAGGVERAELIRAWDGAAALVEALARVVPDMSSRPRMFPLGDGDAAPIWAVRGGCCFVYRLGPGVEYCATCPLLDDATRAVRLLRWMREQRGGGNGGVRSKM